MTLPWDEWWDDVLTQDDSNSHIALLPLHPHLRAKFNETAAWEYARSSEGKPYGYHNMIFSWIDTLDENYPPPLDAHVVLFFSIVKYFIFWLHLQYRWILYFFSFISISFKIFIAVILVCGYNILVIRSQNYGSVAIISFLFFFSLLK